MLWIGLTGSMGSGKSAVAVILRELGFPVLDADAEARSAMAQGTEGSRKVIQAFGPDLQLPNGEIDRAALAQIVFRAPDKLAQLEKIIHPIVQSSVRAQRDKLSANGERAAFYDVPLLYEKKLESQFDKVIVVNSKLENLIQRVRARSGLSHDDIMNRLKNQIPLLEKCARADVVIENNGTLADLKNSVRSALAEIGLPTPT